jgi:ferredoxin/flavodoxin
MALEIYYFTGTGNSLAVARGIAEKMNAALIPIASLMDQPSVKTTSEEIGIIFPAYMAQLNGVPLIIENFIKRLENIRSKYIFAVCTCGGQVNFNALPALKNLGRLIRSCGGRLSAEYGVKLPMNTLDYSAIPFPIEKDQEAMFKKMPARIDYICNRLLRKKRDRFWTAKALLNLLVTPLYAVLKKFYIEPIIKYSKEPDAANMSYRELMPLTDRSFTVNDKCDGCGVCEKVCPAHNIKMAGGKPFWLDRCELCLACSEFCHARAIHHCWRPDGNYYHHPSVSAADLIVQSRRS